MVKKREQMLDVGRAVTTVLLQLVDETAVSLGIY